MNFFRQKIIFKITESIRNPSFSVNFISESLDPKAPLINNVGINIFLPVQTFVTLQGFCWKVKWFMAGHIDFQTTIGSFVIVCTKITPKSWRVESFPIQIGIIVTKIKYVYGMYLEMPQNSKRINFYSFSESDGTNGGISWKKAY